MDYFWESEGWERRDKHLSMLDKMPFKRPFPFIPQQKGLYILRGPRQVGKSSWLKTILLKHRNQGAQCFYLSCELIEHYKELAEILHSVRDRKLVLLDEVNFVKNWDRAVKHAVDSGATNILVVTGSHAHDLARGADRMPGRFEAGGEFELLPMGFDEFTAMRGQAGWQLPSRHEELKAYFRIGGFPEAIAEAGVKSIIPKKAFKTYWRWLSGDAVKLGKQEDYLLEVFAHIAKILQTPTSLQNFAKNTRLGSHNTVQEYIEILESCYAVRTLLAVDLDTGSFKFKKNRKLYFTDPLLYWLALDLAAEKPAFDIEAKLAEMVAHEELSRRYRRFGYYSGPNGEIDFIIPKRWALEVKWSAVAKDISKSYLQNTAPWKVIWTHNNFLKDFPPD